MPDWTLIIIFTSVLGALGYILKRLDSSVTELTKVTSEQGKLLVGFQERTKADIKEVRHIALSADRQSALNETQLVDHEKRIGKIETEHILFHNKKED